jgi:nucleoside-diphosphate-sugar epimerase
MIALVTGATGFIGSRLIDHLLRSGKNEVYALVRNPSKLSWIKSVPGFHLLRGNLFSLPPLPANCEVVFHLAGLTKAVKPDDYYTVNHMGTASLLNRLAASGLSPRFIFLSSLAAGSPAIKGKPVKEDDPPEPASPYGKSKLLAEQEIFKYKDRMERVILRAAAIYGPGDRDFLQFFQLINRGWLFTFARKITMSLCYVDDLVRAMEICARSMVKSGEIYNVADPVPRTWEDIGEEAARILGRKVRKIRVPLWLARTAAGASEMVSRITGKPSTLNLSKYRDMEKLSWVADTSKIKRDLGFEAIWSFSQALKETLEWYKANGWL